MQCQGSLFLPKAPFLGENRALFYNSFAEDHNVKLSIYSFWVSWVKWEGELLKNVTLLSQCDFKGVTRILLLWVNSVLNSLPSACTHSQNAPVELWGSCQTNFTRAKPLNHSDFFGRLSIRPSFGVREEEICRRQRWGPAGEVAKGERMHFFYYSPFPQKHILRLLFWDIFAGIALKLKQVRLTFSSFNCPSYSIHWLRQMTWNSNCFKTKL